MSMYLPNSGLHPTGAEVVEFIDPPPVRERPVPVRLDPETRLDIARWAEEYISGLVGGHNGTPDDVRTIIHDLHRRTHVRS